MSKSGGTKPARLEILVANIPERLRKLRRWVVWKWCRRKKKWDKPPRQPKGELASVDDPSTWCTFDEAMAARETGKFDGIGFVLGYVEEEDVTYTGVDLDGCRDPQTGQLQEWAVSHLQRLDTYAEVSPSAEGAKALAIGTLPGPDRNDSDRSGLEMYSGGRYFTITGHKLEETPAEIGERTAELAELYYLVFGDGEPVRRKASRQPRPQDRSLALSALEGLSPSLATNYRDWLGVGMALHAVGDDQEMLDAWDRWSRHDTEKYEDGVCKKKWESFGKKGGLGLGSLIYWARQNGWELPRSPSRDETSTPADTVILQRIDAALAEGVESFFRDRELLESLGRLAETDPPEFACVRARLQKAGISLRSLDASIASFRQAVRAERPPVQSAGTYRIVGGRIVLTRMTKDGVVEIPLGNFVARIMEVVTRDDGIEKTAVFAIEGELANGRPLPRLQVPAAEFQRMEWVTTGWHGEAVLFAGSSIRDHVRCAIELLSCDRVRRVQYLHTGWREIAGRWVFLHAGGALSEEGTLTGYEVELAGSLGRVCLPEPPVGDDLKAAIRASLGLLSLAADRITVPLLAGTYRAPFGDLDFSEHLVGPSGVFKTELASLQQGHFGPTFDSRNIPGSWSSTENALEELAHAAKDIVLVIDDFKPTGSSYDVQAYHRKADRLLRAVGNHSGRQRMNRDGKLRPERRPRGLVLSTGEESPFGESLRARMWTLEVGYGDIDIQRLTRAQKDAVAGRFAAAMSGYLCWLARGYAERKAQMATEREALRAKAIAEAGKGHARSPGIMADLAIGMKYFLDFAVESGAITTEERTALAKRTWAALGEAVAAQAASIAASEPTSVFTRLLAAALASGRAHLAGPDGKEPDDPQAWGWRQVDQGSGDFGRTEWRPQGRRVGWVEVRMVRSVRSEQVYLEPEASFAEVQSLAREQGESFPISPRTLHRRLRDKHLLASTEPSREVLTVRHQLEGIRRSVLHLYAHLLRDQPNRPDQPDQPDHLNAKGDNSSTSGGQVRGSGPPHPTTNLTTAGGQPDHFHNPTTDLTTPSPCQSKGSDNVVGLVRSETEAGRTPDTNPSSPDREVFEL
jgi:hypothetical protein